VINDTNHFSETISKFISALQHATNERYDVGNGFSQEEKQVYKVSIALSLALPNIKSMLLSCIYILIFWLGEQ